MSTTIKDTVASTDVQRLSEDAAGRVTFIAQEGNKHAYAIMARADFLAAVATECNVLIIDRADLPEVTSADARNSGTASAHRREALWRLALAEYLDAHPPVDEADVESLARHRKEGDAN